MRRQVIKAAPRRPMPTVWLAAVILAVNLFGWIGTAPRPADNSANAAATVMAMFDAVPLCEHGALPHPGRDGDDGKPVCPACFPFGNAASGALVCDPPAVLLVVEPRAVERHRPPDAVTPSSYGPHPYQARAPPAFA